jgi:hypothetical protein
MMTSSHWGYCFFASLNRVETLFLTSSSSLRIHVKQIAGAYPGVTAEEFLAVTSEPPAELGQWAYDFTDPNG